MKNKNNKMINKINNCDSVYMKTSTGARLSEPFYISVNKNNLINYIKGQPNKYQVLNFDIDLFTTQKDLDGKTHLFIN
tara:strand:+ start:40 stop:273 length:234 start_codon:yes stop_codon:yes gene_type:complete